MIGRDPSLWYQHVEVDKGSDDGVALDDPVTGDGALVGKVTSVTGSTSIVTLITDHSYAVAAQVLNSRGDTGVLVPAVGNPNQLLLQSLPNHASIAAGEQVVTAGFKSTPSPSLQSLYPPGIPIGTVFQRQPEQAAQQRPGARLAAGRHPPLRLRPDPDPAPRRHRAGPGSVSMPSPLSSCAWPCSASSRS